MGKMQNEDLLISIIVPVYNNEQYIVRCITSLCKQTYKNIECIIVDDGSSDNSLKICQQLANRDSRIKVYHTENNGVSSARNFGLDKVSGDIVTFIDSDDYIDVKVVEKAYKIVSNNKNIIVTYGMKKCKGDKMFDVPFHHREIVYDFIHFPVYMHSVCNKFFSVSLLKNIRFDTDISVCEDFLFVFKAMLNAEGYQHIENCFYYYEENLSSASNRELNAKWIMDYKNVANRIEQYCICQGKKSEYQKLIDYRKMYHAIVYLSNPEFYNPSIYRKYNLNKKVWTYTCRPDFLMMTFFSNCRIDFLSKIYVALKSFIK